MGRPSKLTPEAQERIVQAIELGATYELAAQYGGVRYATMRRWLIAGEEARSGKYHDFYEAVKAAEGRAAVRWLTLIEQAAADTWQAAAWKLERRYPRDFGRTVVSQEVSGPGGSTLQVRVVWDNDLDGDTDADDPAS